MVKLTHIILDNTGGMVTKQELDELVYKATNGKIVDSNIDFNIIMHEVEITEGDYVEGYNSGYEAGFDEGKEENAIDKYNEGYEKGYKDGFDDGCYTTLNKKGEKENAKD